MDTLANLVKNMDKLKDISTEDLDKQMKIGGLQAKLMGQQNAMLNAQVQILEHRKQIQRYQTTLVSLESEIATTKQLLDEAIKEGGE
jgi:hypothetical protein